MPDAKHHLSRLDLLEAPDVWTDAETRRTTPDAPIAHPAPRTRQRVLAAVVALGIFGGAALLGLRAFDTVGDRAAHEPSSSIPAPADPAGVWQPLPAPPIAYRYGATGFWVGGRVVVLGGWEAPPPCPVGAICDMNPGRVARGGAAYDPSTGTWTTISEPPRPAMLYSAAVVGETLYAWGTDDQVTEESLLAYHAPEDRWEELPPPNELGTAAGGYRLAAAGDEVLAYLDSQEHGATRDLVYRPADRTWEELPPDPLIPSFDRSMVWTGSEVVLIATEVQPPEVATYRDRVATLDLATSTWRHLPNSGTEGNPTWFWSAGRVVNPEIGHVGDYRSVEGAGPPYGGIFDPSTGVWSELPPAPDGLVPYHGPSVGGDRYVATSQGAILEVATGSWEALPAAPVAADEGAVAVWAGDRLVVWGGLSRARPGGAGGAAAGDSGNASATIVEAGWSWIPSSS